MENLFLAWKEFKKGKRKRLDIQEFEFNLEDSLFQLHRELEDKTYRHGNYESFNVTDPKLRRISKASVRDRVLHQAVFRVLYHIFDKTFIYDSYSCRLEKGTHKAVSRLEEFCRKLSHNNTKTIFALKCDIKKFFDSIDHGILLNLIKRKISGNTIWLINIIIDSFHKITKGLPLGNVTSQLFANIYLNEFDQFVKHQLKQKYYIRYCDDFVILAEDQYYLRELAVRINNFLADNLKLSLHPGKITIQKYRQGIDFLGYVALLNHRVLRTRTKKRLLRRVNFKNLPSYLGVLKHCRGFKLIKNLLFSLYKQYKQ